MVEVFLFGGGCIPQAMIGDSVGKRNKEVSHGSDHEAKGEAGGKEDAQKSRARPAKAALASEPDSSREGGRPPGSPQRIKKSPLVSVSAARRG
jgi:hypothetical protein